MAEELEQSQALDGTPRRGDWFVTYTGRRFFPFDARVEDIDIKDIAHSLSLQTRWNGHCRTFYSIASHSLACARVVERSPFFHTAEYRGIRNWALMHDAAEAYLGDIIRPIKRSLGVWRDGFHQNVSEAIEEPLLRLIAEKFGLPWPMPQEVHDIDNRMLVTEAYHLTSYANDKHWIHEKPWCQIKPYGDDHVLIHQMPTMAEETFLKIAREYFPTVR